ncbi:stage III sporulation protein AH [[Eubacterium] hominis]|uniref:stage III sporulation protein AH n=1 Tax=[Eubacterium] hominis TaxID=2764325 RepID=UPI003A4E44BA
MNKQALAFLTMFSLVLMLSVYYVTLPSDSTSVMDEKDKTTEKVNGESEKENTSQTETKDKAKDLQDEINQKKETELNSSSEVIANKDSEEQEKQEALSTMDEVKEQQQLQEQIKNALAKEKLNAAVEIKDTTCTITIFDTKEDKKTAASVMKIASDIVNQKYLIEVSFK